jgi:predicted acetyltransferase
MTVRACSCAEELRAALAPIFHFFGTAPTGETGEQFALLLPPDRMLAADEDGVVVGGAGSFPFELTVPGGTVSAAGVTVVGVLPTHRRRGILRAMMRAQLDDVHARGEPVAYLWASDDRIYGRFGFGIASFTGEIELARERSAFFAPLEPLGAPRLLSLEAAVDVFPAIYDRVRSVTPGMFGRTRVWWETRALADLEWRRRGGGDLVAMALEDGGEAVGYALYRIHALERISVVEAMGATPEAERAVWRYLLDVDWVERTTASLLPVDHPLLLLLAEPRRLNYKLSDGLWVRLVDVGAALAARSFASDGEVVFEVADAFCPWNEGRWTSRGERTAAEPDLRLDVRELGSVYLGGFTFGQLARAGRIEELVPGAIARADALFATDRAPWCPEIF